ncbi:unnamed protein product [Hyaloperonospora brassicae]|uniref:RxLR effector candidate protein n=1 Tax=Hyaloperonospora brassicae TaxID=162125 RepID=A0AAV0UXJ0_HYABA|nr:unnamed protein product [Hyaloperonospora brassicae]
MRLYLFAPFLVVGMLIVLVDPALASRASEIKTRAPECDNCNGHQKTNSSVGQGDEDRGISWKSFGLGKLTTLFESARNEELQLLSHIEETIESAYKTAGLSLLSVYDKEKVMQPRLVVDFFLSYRFKSWMKHAFRKNKKDPFGAMFAALKDDFNEKNVAILILLAKDSRRTRSIALKLEDAQVKWWFSRGYTPKYILENIIDVRLQYLHTDSRLESLYVRYETFYKKNLKKKQAQTLLYVDETIKDASTTSELSSISEGSYIKQHLVVDFFLSPEFTSLVKRASSKNKQNPYGAVFAYLKDIYNEVNVAAIIRYANDSKEVRSIGKELEKAQFEWWHWKGYNPNDIPDRIFGLKPQDVKELPWLRGIFKRYGKFFEQQPVSPTTLFMAMHPSWKQKGNRRAP